MPEPVTETQEQPAVERRSFDELMAELDYHLRHESEETRAAAKEALRKHDVVAGIAGEIGDRLAQSRLQTARDEATKQEADRLEKELADLAQNDPEAFAEKYLQDRGVRLQQKELATLRFNERKALADQLGRAVADLPEWSELTQDEMAEIGSAMQRSPENPIAAYQKAVVDVIGRKRGTKLFEATKAEWLKTEREAWEAEHRAEVVKNGVAPSLRRGAARGTDSDEPDHRDTKAYNDWYEKTVLKKRG